jgi:hypothetical protein
MRRAVAIGLLATILAAFLHVDQPDGDFFWPLCAARTLPADPYPSNPLTTALILLPFPRGSGALVFGLASGLLAYGARGRHWLVFLSPAYWSALLWLQWSPFVAACYLLPSLTPLAIVKPQIGLPVLLTRLTVAHSTVVAALVLASLCLLPTWLASFLAELGSYTGVVPLLWLPILPLLLIWRRDRSALTLLLMACFPQRDMYDLSTLFLLPTTWQRTALVIIGAWLLVLFAPAAWPLVYALTLLSIIRSPRTLPS